MKKISKSFGKLYFAKVLISNIILVLLSLGWVREAHFLKSKINIFLKLFYWLKSSNSCMYLLLIYHP